MTCETCGAPTWWVPGHKLESACESKRAAMAECKELRTQLAAMTAERDALQTSMNELRKTCAEIIGADPQTWPDHGNAPLAIAACLGLRDAELQKTTAERDAALAKVAVLREVTTELEVTIRVMGLDSEPLARMAENARNALEATK